MPLVDLWVWQLYPANCLKTQTSKSMLPGQLFRTPLDSLGSDFVTCLARGKTSCLQSHCFGQPVVFVEPLNKPSKKHAKSMFKNNQMFWLPKIKWNLKRSGKGRNPKKKIPGMAHFQSTVSFEPQPRSSRGPSKELEIDGESLLRRCCFGCSLGCWMLLWWYYYDIWYDIIVIWYWLNLTCKHCECLLFFLFFYWFCVSHFQSFWTPRWCMLICWCIRGWVHLVGRQMTNLHMLQHGGYPLVCCFKAWAPSKSISDQRWTGARSKSQILGELILMTLAIWSHNVCLRLKFWWDICFLEIHEMKVPHKFLLVSSHSWPLSGSLNIRGFGLWYESPPESMTQNDTLYVIGILILTPSEVSIETFWSMFLVLL